MLVGGFGARESQSEFHTQWSCATVSSVPTESLASRASNPSSRGVLWTGAAGHPDLVAVALFACVGLSRYFYFRPETAGRTPVVYKVE